MSLRIVALTVDPTLSVAMTMIPQSDVHETDNLFTAARLAAESDVLVVGLGSTELGQAAVYDLQDQGISTPMVVVGDRAPAEGWSLDMPLLLPPFTVEDIVDAANEAMVGAQLARLSEPPASSPETRAEFRADEPLVPTQAEFSADEPLVPPEPEFKTDEPLVPPEPEFKTDEPLVPPEPRPAADHPAPESKPVGAAEARPQRLEAPAPPTTQTQVERVSRPARSPVAPPAEAPRPARPEPRRRFRRNQESTQVRRTPVTVDDRLRHALQALADVHGLLDDMPFLADPGALAGALLDEVRERLKPELAGVLLRSGDALATVAAHGFTPQEMGMKVALNQPLIVQFLTTHEAVFIAPVDLARGLLTGIPGTRTEALVAAPITHGSELLAVILVGSSSFTGDALALVDDVAREAAAGLAVAQAVDRLRLR